MPKTRSDRLVVSKRWWLSQILSVGLPPSKYRVGTIVRKGWQVRRNHFAFLGFDPTPFPHLSLVGTRIYCLGGPAGGFRGHPGVEYESVSIDQYEVLFSQGYRYTGSPDAKTGESGNPGLLGGELSSAQLCVTAVSRCVLTHQLTVEKVVPVISSRSSPKQCARRVVHHRQLTHVGAGRVCRSSGAPTIQCAPCSSHQNHRACGTVDEPRTYAGLRAVRRRHDCCRGARGR